MNTEESLAFTTPEAIVGTEDIPARDALCDQLLRDIGRLNELGRRVRGHKPMPPDLVIAMQAFWQSSETYYSVARQRSTGMAKNIAAVMNQRRCERVIAVSGGFHSSDVSNWLAREAAMATLTIRPNVGKSGYELKAAEYRYNRRGLTEE